MVWLNGNRMILVVVGVVAGMVLGNGSAKADFILGELINLGPNINTPGDETSSCISPDGLEFYFSSDNRPDGLGEEGIWVAKRQTAENPWGTAVNHIGWQFYAPCFSADGLELYFCSNRSGGSGRQDIWVTTRDTTQNDWGPPVNLGPTINSPYVDFSPSISSDGLSLFFSDGDWGVPVRPGGHGQSDIWVSTRATKEAQWGEPVNLGPPVNSAEHDTTPSLSSDGLILVFGRGSFLEADIWLTRRKTTDDPWEAPIRLGLEMGAWAWGGHPDISFDGSTIYWTSWGRPGGFGGGDIWQVPILPVVDLNGDGIVDSADMCIMLDNWGTDNSLCDIGPMPWGDGIVDVQDLIVLAEHLFEEFPPAQ